MNKFLNRLGVRVKLLTSFVLLASFVLILGVTAIFIQKKIKQNQSETLAGIHLSDAFFEAKYFMRSDMHIFTELIKTSSQDRLDYWWGEHEFQIQFFNDQLKKIEQEFYIKESFENDTLQNQVLAVVNNIKKHYEQKMLPVFNKFHTLKTVEFDLNRKKQQANLDSLTQAQLNQELEIMVQNYQLMSQEVTDYGLSIITQLDAGKDQVRKLIKAKELDGIRILGRVFIIFLGITVLGVLFSILIAAYTSLLIARPVRRILQHVNKLRRGEHPDLMEIKMEDEFGTIQKALNDLTHSLIQTSVFSNEIGNGNFDAEYKPMSENDVLGNSLLQMRDSLKSARDEENKRRIEDERRTWVANGLAKFGDIMRQSGDGLKAMGYNLMSSLTDYLGAVQGALFVVNDENPEDIYYELISAIAYGRDKFMQKQIKVGEGLVGRVAYEEKTIYLKDVPENYVKITSGLGTSNPRTILLVPVKLEDKVNGVIELISFKEMEPYQVEFVEKVGETIASFIASIKINEKTALLLSESRSKSEELSAQEEEMRQNMEELQATQEEAARREEERNMLWEALGKINGIIETDLNGTILNANQHLCKLINRSLTELTGKNYHDLFLTKVGESAESIWNKVTAGQIVNLNINYPQSAEFIEMKHQLTLVNNAQGNGLKILIVVQSN
jgi:nitrogen fixation/metabolism regulation signal transduction histidine kinase